MENRNIIFAKLAGINRKLVSLLGPSGARGRPALRFEKNTIEEIYKQFSALITDLKKMNPEIYDDLEDRKFPEVSTDGFVMRSFVEMLLRDIEYIFEVHAQLSVERSKEDVSERRVFISHGSNEEWRKVQAFIEKDAGFQTLELAQQANVGRTIIQKLDEESDKCSYVVVIMTGDDKTTDGSTRVRENVMHEIGFFQGKYGINNVCLLHEEGTNIPSNIHGIVYIPFPPGIIEATFGVLLRELSSVFV